MCGNLGGTGQGTEKPQRAMLWEGGRAEDAVLGPRCQPGV